MAESREGRRLRIRRAHHPPSRRLRAVAERVWEFRHEELPGRTRPAEGLRRRLPEARLEGRILLFAAELVFREGLQKLHVWPRRAEQSGVPAARRRPEAAHDQTFSGG